jgi:hypothetical protein
MKIKILAYGWWLSFFCLAMLIEPHINSWKIWLAIIIAMYLNFLFFFIFPKIKEIDLA